MEILGCFVVNNWRIVKFAKPSKIHGDLIIESHELWWLIEVFQVFMVVKYLNKAFDKFAIDIHGILIEAIIEVICQFLILSLAIGGIGKVILVEGMLEYVFGLYDVDWSSSHLGIYKYITNRCFYKLSSTIIQIMECPIWSIWPIYLMKIDRVGFQTLFSWTWPCYLLINRK